MLYLSGLFALNIPCQLISCGDCHYCTLDFDNPMFLDSDKMFFREYGIEPPKIIRDISDEPIYIANHIRAFLDLLELGNFSAAQDIDKMICNDDYDLKIFGKVQELIVAFPQNAEKINDFMSREYRLRWIKFKNP